MKKILLITFLFVGLISFSQDEIKYKTAFENVEQNCDSLKKVELCYLTRFQLVVNRKFTDELKKNEKLSKYINGNIYLEINIDTSGTILINKIETKSSLFEKALLDLVKVLPKIKINTKDEKWDAILEFKLKKINFDNSEKLDIKNDKLSIKTPRFSNCSSVIDEETNKKCFELNMNNHIRTYFKYPKKALSNNISGRTNGNLIINKQGEIDNYIIHGADILLQRETLRILKSLPTFIPGQLNDEIVSVSYTQPIMYKLE